RLFEPTRSSPRKKARALFLHSLHSVDSLRVSSHAVHAGRSSVFCPSSSKTRGFDLDTTTLAQGHHKPRTRTVETGTQPVVAPHRTWINPPCRSPASTVAASGMG